MIVIGESNATGGGIKKHRHLLYHRLFSQWWDKVISPTTGTKLTVENLSLRGTGNDFFKFCLQFHNTGWWTRYSVYRVISKRLWIHTQRTPHATSIILEIISISSVSLVNFVNKCASLSSAKNPRCHNSEELGQRELATHYGITLLSWRDILCPVNLADGIRKAIIRLGMVIDNHLHNDIKGPAQITLMQIRYFKKILQRTSQQLFCAKSPMKDSSFTSSSILVTNPHCWASTNSCGVRFCVFA